MTDDRERWALILGASCGMGEATALALARGRLQDLRHPPRLPGRPRARRGGQGRRSRRPASEALYINMNAADDEKRAAALATLRERFDRVRGGGPRSRTSGSSCTRSRSARSCRSSAEDPKGARRPQEDGDDPGRDGQQPRLLGPGPVARRVPRAGLEDLRDDLGGLDPGRAVVRRRVVGQGRPRIAHPPAGDGARPTRHGHRRPTRSGPA